MMYTDLEKKQLGALVEVIIPASAKYDVPGAGDDLVLADILGMAASQRDAVCQGLAVLEALAQEAGGAGFAALSAEQQARTALDFKAAQPELAGLIAVITAQCYYRDDRVMRSLNMEVRAPFPQGFEVQQGDWSLLDPVRAREEFWRKAP